MLQSELVRSHIKKCVERGKTVGPFPSPPLPNFVASPIGLIPKKNGKFRLIHHLSAPVVKNHNDRIAKKHFSLKYIKA